MFLWEGNAAIRKYKWRVVRAVTEGMQGLCSTVSPIDCFGSRRASGTPCLPHTTRRWVQNADGSKTAAQGRWLMVLCGLSLSGVVLSTPQRWAPQHCLAKGGRQAVTPAFIYPSPCPQCITNAPGFLMPPALEAWLWRSRVCTQINTCFCSQSVAS